MGGQSLRVEAESIIEGLGLIELLSTYGEAAVVGGVALDLIVKPDIDIHVVITGRDVRKAADRIFAELSASTPNVHIHDYSERGGLKVGVDPYHGPTRDWSIDIWVTDRPETCGRIPTERLAQRLTPEHREAIMRIKAHYHALGLCENGLSVRIYEAVVDEGIRTVDEFDRFLSGKQEGRTSE